MTKFGLALAFKYEVQLFLLDFSICKLLIDVIQLQIIIIIIIISIYIYYDVNLREYFSDHRIFKNKKKYLKLISSSRSWTDVIQL